MNRSEFEFVPGREGSPYDILQNALEGYKMGRAPKEMKRKEREQELRNSLLETKSQYAPQEAELGIRQKQLRNQMLEQDAERYPDTLDMREALMRARTEGGGRVGAQQKQYAPSGLSKLYSELNEIQNGYLPGSNGSVPLDEDQKEQLANSYQLKIQNYTTDAALRNRALFARNLILGFEQSNIKDLTQYAGPVGQARLAADTALDAAGKSPERYKKYQEAKTAAEVDAKELRQYLGESISHEAKEAINAITNPPNEWASPEVAQRKIMKARDILAKQMKISQQGLKSTAPYREEQKEMKQDERALGTLSVEEIRKLRAARLRGQQ